MELQESCATLGIESSRCLAINHPFVPFSFLNAFIPSLLNLWEFLLFDRQLQDSPTNDWSGTVIKEIVKQQVEKWGVDAVSSSSSLM